MLTTSVRPLHVLLFITRALRGCQARVFPPAPSLFCSTLIWPGSARAWGYCLLWYPLSNSGEPNDLSLRHFYYISLQISFLYDHQLLIFFVSLSILNRGSKPFMLAKEVMIFSVKNPVVSYSTNFIRTKSEAANGGCRICNKHVSWDWKQHWVFFFFSFQFFPGSLDSFFHLLDSFGFSIRSISLKRINFLLELF